MDIKNNSRKEYISRINRVMDFIESRLDSTIDLNILAGIANFSPYHFHRVFTALTGETPNNFLQRIRLEKSAQLLLDNPNLTIGEIAYSCGFNDLSSFSRSFRKYFGTTAKSFRESEKAIFVKDNIRYSKNGKVVSNNRKNKYEENLQFCVVNFKNLIIMDTKIEIKEMPEMKVVYVRHTGDFSKIGTAYDKIFKWAGARGLLKFPKTKSLTVYHDDPAVTSIDKVRQSACVTIDEDIPVDGEVGKMTVDGGKYAVAHFEINQDGFEKAWNTVYNWFSESGYQPDNKNCYELYYNNCEEHPEKKFIIDICIPVKPL